RLYPLPLLSRRSDVLAGSTLDGSAQPLTAAQERRVVPASGRRWRGRPIRTSCGAPSAFRRPATNQRFAHRNDGSAAPRLRCPVPLADTDNPAFKRDLGERAAAINTITDQLSGLCTRCATFRVDMG